MTEPNRPDRHPGSRKNYWKLAALLAAAAFAYQEALSPVLASVRQVAGQQARRTQLSQSAQQLAKSNRLAAARLRREQQRLQSDLAQEGALRDELAHLTAQRPAAPVSGPTFAGVSVPAVHTTTGASGRP